MQTLAPIHLLPRRDAPLGHWPGGFGLMNRPADYTPLESLFLIQVLTRHGLEPAGFSAASNQLINNALIKADKTYDAARLNPDALQQLFVHLLFEDSSDESATPYKTDGPTSPNSKRRRLSRPLKPTLQEAKARVDKLPALVDRLYTRYRDDVLDSVREEDRQLEILAKEIKELEAEEQADKAKAAAQCPTAPNGTPGPRPTPTPVPVPSLVPNTAQVAIAQTPVKPSTPTPAAETTRPIRPAQTPSATPVQTPVPVPTPVPLPPQAQIKQPAASSPVPPPAQPRRDVAPPVGAFQRPPAAPPAQAASPPEQAVATPATAPQARPQQGLKPPSGAAQVLQPPVGAVHGAGQPPIRPGKSTSPVPLPAISPRPDTKPRSSPGLIMPMKPGTLKWEKPYQPATPASQPQVHPASPQMPTTSAPSTPGQVHHHPSQYYPQPTGQYHGPQHPSHVPIQPNQGQRYPQQSQPVLVPPQPQGQPQGHTQPPAPVQSQPQAQAQAHAPQAQSQAQQQNQLRHRFVAQGPPKGQLIAPMHSTPVKGPPEGSAIQPPSGRVMSTTPIAPPVRPQPGQHQQSQQAAHLSDHSHHPQPLQPAQPPQPVQPSQPSQPPQPTTGYPHHHRPLAAASPTPPPAPPAQNAMPAPRWPQTQQAPYAQSQFSPSPAPAQLPGKAADNQRRVSSPFNRQQTQSAVPARLVPQPVASPTPAQRAASTPIPPPRTPVAAAVPTFLLTGSGTKWTVKSTPSTPRPTGLTKEVASPGFEPLSPVQQPAPLPVSTPSQPAKKASPKPVPKTEIKPRPRGRPPRSANKIRAESTPSSVVGVARRSQSVASQTDELSMDHHDLAPRVKDENATPRATPRSTPKPQDDTGDTTADESVPSRRNMITPSSVSSRLAHKRKRQESPADTPPVPPTHVLWTRQFGRVSAAALDQIGAHRFANQFANPIRERDAPGYKTLIVQPQDIKSIRAAITHGNRAATEAAKALPDGDPGTGSVLLPISDDLVPPKSIINSAQLERELFHMFANAVMYNLNPSRGPGPAFMKGNISADGTEILGYEVDEDAVVRSTRMMAGEVEKIIVELRNAENQRTGQALSASGNTRPASVATGEDTPMEDDVDELAGDADISSTTRRRRVGTRS
ncbi:hypothetical protein CMUS01_09656 [Colletotrichum musicola]|uniref:Bromo domain-containing protein n=1 Tax=Colletotrichum musicola TaxID=2175873 RepID=A0A8H6NA61_9PEZI|nr:hypothetical protein CMUS01_09656 [Colletotrichum musicola]